MLGYPRSCSALYGTLCWRMYAHTSSCVQSTSGFTFTSLFPSSHSILWTAVRVTDCSRRSPVIHASSPDKRPAQRLHLADAAAQLPVLHRVIEQVHAVLGDHGLHGVGLWKEHLDRRPYFCAVASMTL